PPQRSPNRLRRCRSNSRANRGNRRGIYFCNFSAVHLANIRRCRIFLCMTRVTEPNRGGAAPAIPRELKNAAAFLRRTRYAEDGFSAGEIRLNEFLDRLEAAADRFLRAIGL